jgi:serine kinase of HPr protein (carbohydrate metabolism regulator)
VLITGLTNPHVIRTAEMLDINCIVFSRGKHPTEDLIEMAQERNIIILTTRHTLYVSCGILYGNGLAGCETRA